MIDYLLPWKLNSFGTPKFWHRTILNGSANIAIVYKMDNITSGPHRFYFGNYSIPFLYSYSILHPWPQECSAVSFFSFTIKNAMSRCDKELLVLGYELITEDRLEKLKLLL